MGSIRSIIGKKKGWRLFSEIKNLKENGLKKAQIARYLGVDYKTVTKYFNMTPDEFADINRKRKSKKLDIYKEQILEWLNTYHDLSSAQVTDWLKERYGNIPCTERTVRSYVSSLRKEYKIPKKVSKRQYEAVEELEMGFQAQVDFGQIWLNTIDGSRIKLYCFAMVLSHSRMKFAYWQDKPFTTIDFIEAHNRAFEFFGGRTKEIVYDQDRLLAVDENFGDVIYTEEFQKYVDLIKFKIRLCRRYDPESKGKIEAVVKYVKNNFARNRVFEDIDSFNKSCLAWLDRTGNANVHGTIKRIPKEVFTLEKQHLIPVFQKQNSPKNILTYTVRKDNTLLYKQNRYQLPKGTYEPGKKVNVVIEGEFIKVLDTEKDTLIVKHRLSNERGKLIKLSHPERDRNTELDKLNDEVLNMLGASEEAKIFLKEIRKEKARYFRDQLGLIKKAVEEIDAEIINKALKYCLERKIYSATIFKEAVEFFNHKEKEYTNTEKQKTNPIPDKFKNVKPQTRSIKEYANIVGG
ncbi:Integrase core domain protein [Caloramator mitchellensis]|uniref:Integrase core domain protein n=1 Tax=Caloramator mitchellensis TaxID=908809 RepID=A0A0R3K0Q2_CALMK|nr:IS21 family transposase [Caloramator mitchellensis]KRQ85839.1 Integrase core domain protein [Caloramator mitchellensis]